MVQYTAFPGIWGPTTAQTQSSVQKQLSRTNLFPNATALLIYKLHW